MTKKRPVGRPTKTGQVRVIFRTDESTKNKYQNAADIAELSLSAWIKKILDKSV